MSNKIGLLGALDILGVGGHMPPRFPGKVFTRYAGAKRGIPMYHIGGVIFDTPGVLTDQIELHQGFVQLLSDERYMDNTKKFRGTTIDGLMTGDGLNQKFYSHKFDLEKRLFVPNRGDQ